MEVDVPGLGILFGNVELVALRKNYVQPFELPFSK